MTARPTPTTGERTPTASPARGRLRTTLVASALAVALGSIAIPTSAFAAESLTEDAAQTAAPLAAAAEAAPAAEAEAPTGEQPPAEAQAAPEEEAPLPEEETPLPEEETLPGEEDGDEHGHQGITICHATSSEGNAYVVIAPDADSIFKQNGHDAHDKQDGLTDIIPPFWYVKNGNVHEYSYEGTGSYYPGKNWDASGQATWENGCVEPQPAPTPESDEPAPAPEPEPEPCELPDVEEPRLTADEVIVFPEGEPIECETDETGETPEEPPAPETPAAEAPAPAPEETPAPASAAPAATTAGLAHTGTEHTLGLLWAAAALILTSLGLMAKPLLARRK
ncbi:hypothetical protein ACWKWP_01330 [Agromyces soli]